MISRRLNRKFGKNFIVAQKNFAIYRKKTLYVQIATFLIIFLLGYFLAYWQMSDGDFREMAINLKENLQLTLHQNKLLKVKFIEEQRRLQVTQATQESLMQQISALQDEKLRLKTDVEFFKNAMQETCRK